MQRSYEMAARGDVPVPAPVEIYCHTLTDDSILSPDLRARWATRRSRCSGSTCRTGCSTTPSTMRGRRACGDLYLAGSNRICAEPFEDCLARDAEGNLCLEIKSPQDIEREVGHDLGNIFHDTLTLAVHRRRIGGGHVGRRDGASARVSLRVVGGAGRGGERHSRAQHRAEDLRGAGSFLGLNARRRVRPWADPSPPAMPDGLTEPPCPRGAVLSLPHRVARYIRSSVMFHFAGSVVPSSSKSNSESAPVSVSTSLPTSMSNVASPLLPVSCRVNVSAV